MNHLIQGGESAERFKLLLSLTKIKEPISSALFDYYVKGVSSGNAAELRGIKHGNVSRGADTLEQHAAIVEAIKQLDWEKHIAKLNQANARIAELEALLADTNK
ncbi:hypothetical protein K5M76_09365 [Shewanella xiamenensis]|uniref:hypothetical protein n=1 Tax=Shewanella xiamenensis TaxID=332186 RepID=UPI00217D1ED7|nr:hypothetical protein [Shewanella xiamenensis]MCT8857583.1 hypothetical protein [Shewanella xiamenensis]UWG66399.1 hypothetical protein K5M76_09365 [Shewanella xiamenensis]